MAAIRKLHIMFYTTNERFIPCDGRQLYDFKECGVDLEVEGVHYIEMHSGSATHVLGPSPARGARRSRTIGRSQCLLVKIWRSTWNTYLG